VSLSPIRESDTQKKALLSKFQGTLIVDSEILTVKYACFRVYLSCSTL